MQFQGKVLLAQVKINLRFIMVMPISVFWLKSIQKGERESLSLKDCWFTVKYFRSLC